MDNRVGPLRVILLALLTVLILAILAGTALYLRDSMLMREGDINYNAGDYSSALARYQVLQDNTLFQRPGGDGERAVGRGQGLSE